MSNIDRNTEINRTIHTYLGRGCYHNLKAWLSVFGSEKSYWECSECGNKWYDNLKPQVVPDYTKDLNAVNEAEYKIMDSVGSAEYAEVLANLLGLESPYNNKNTTYIDYAVIATVDAKTRADAVMKFLEEK